MAATAKGTDLVIFGASGDLARRKVLPALEAITDKNATVRVVGAGRSEMSQEDFRKLVGEATGGNGGNGARLAKDAEWVRLDYGKADSYGDLKRLVDGSR